MTQPEMIWRINILYLHGINQSIGLSSACPSRSRFTGAVKTKVNENHLNDLASNYLFLRDINRSGHYASFFGSFCNLTSALTGFLGPKI